LASSLQRVRHVAALVLSLPGDCGALPWDECIEEISREITTKELEKQLLLLFFTAIFEDLLCTVYYSKLQSQWESCWSTVL